ncbi:hypothetical protein [Duganella violaceipulchra]|uniref:Uncharacterized protein n=1 Tax=Duganella violaceipulchra TaxID=2849652 RepID=A0AA41H8R4_9BURK|nr:hypothetical protein [Duganella violaceicalia]MBV6321931.1 hypothetical protein [Duganella violaceicalia]MCP2007075.1 hypothetical protein [Duganella violaceicalia]
MHFDDTIPSRAEARQDARKQAQAGAERALADADRRNGALMRKDSRMVRLLKAYCAVPDDGRDAFVDRAVSP